MSSLHTPRHVPARYQGPAEMERYARNLARQAAAEQARMDLIRAQQTRNPRTPARAR